MKSSEQNIIDQLINGNNLAYKYIYDKYYTLLCKMAGEFLKDSFLAQTVVDDVIFHVWEIRESLNISISLRSYLARAVRNRCINYLQLESVKREVSFSVLSPATIDNLGNIHSEDYPLTRVLEQELEEEIQKAISKLPDECRIVFEKSRYEQKTYQEIAGELNISVNTVKYHIKRALSLLGAAVVKCCPFFFLIF